MAVSTPVVINQLKALSKEYKIVYDRLMVLSNKFRAGMPSMPLDILVPDSEVVDKIREAGESASIAVQRVLEVSVWLSAAAEELAQKAKEDGRK